MSEVNKSYRIKTRVGGEYGDNFIAINTDLIQDYDVFDILSLKINSSEMYRLHNSQYGVIVGRVLANNGFGVPNAKLSIFIPSDNNDGDYVRSLYPFITSSSKDDNGVRYNLLPDEKVSDCHQPVGTFPNKRFVLDNDVVLEVYDKYYKYTTRTNNSGDYLLTGVPVGTHTLHMDLDLSDCGILSQKPRDFVYKGYTIEQFENPTMFKSGTSYTELSQIFSQDQIVTVRPFWGNESLGEPIGITRSDINVSFKFESTCVFIGSIASDSNSNGITKKCMATENMGNMEELTTGSGTIEMIRKTPSGEIESFQIRGTQLINSAGVWCYQIPMNLDYMMTDEYGNMVPTDDPSKGIPTRTSVRFRISMQDNNYNLDNFYRAKVLVPHNPQILEDGTTEEYDYEFGSLTRDDSFRDLFWDNVYTVKSYIPRFQKKKVRGWRDKKFTGIKNCNFYGNNNPIPYNNLRIRLPLMFTIMCAIIKCLIFLTSVFNTVINRIGLMCARMGGIRIFKWRPFGKMWDAAIRMKLNVLSEGLCPDLENWYFAPILDREVKPHKQYNLLKQTLSYINKDNGFYDEKAIDYTNVESESETVCLTIKTDYLISCVEMNLAMEYRVINFDFYNDWINGFIYVPRFMRYIKPKLKFLGLTLRKAKVKGCMDDSSVFGKTRRYTQQCSISYKSDNVDNKYAYVNAHTPLLTSSNKGAIKKSNNFHKKAGFTQVSIFGRKGGICHEHTTSRKQYVYYMKPCEWKDGNSYKTKVNLFATDIVLLGSLKTCDENGLPQAFRYLSSTSYIMPTNLALTNMETNGHLYTNDNKTICAGSSNQLLSSDLAKDNGITEVSSDIGLSHELSMYEGSRDSNIDTQYDGEELSDVVALTEAAGISWNYTGPGQGKPDDKLMYQPGGHFLGLSCINAASNIKSCINLSRICEVGVAMSQRKEDIAYLNEKGEPVYYYTAPTGFISGNDIVGDDFRTMFATMNYNRLQATSFNPETGYYYYNFNFIKPINFNGSFKKMIQKGNEKYNNGGGKLVPEENATLFRGYGIMGNDRRRPDYDENEANHTQTKTYEDTSIDYYRFRFGLNDNDLDKKNNKRHNSKFLSSDGNKKTLPQYENSFYFYFGMKAGASAIDEFNKQFFSTCETSVLKQPEPVIDIRVEEIDLCQGTGLVKVILDNIETPIGQFTYTFDNGDGVQIKNAFEDENKNKYVHELTLEFGKYLFEVVDSNGVTLSKEIQVGVDLFTYDITVHNFNVNNASQLQKPRVDNANANEFFGGSVEISNLSVDMEYLNDLKNEVFLSIDGVNMSTDEAKVSTEWGSEESAIIYVNSANTRYNLYLTFECNSVAGVPHKVFLQTFEVRDGSSVELRMGFENIPFYINIASNSGNSMITSPTKERDNNGHKYKQENDKEPYLLFGGKETTWPEDGIGDNDNVNKWLKRLSILKTTSSGTPFSNNIYASKGEKIIWGVPQNETGLSEENKIYCSEGPMTDYVGFNLDDEASYNATNKNYSAIAVDGDVVSGDFFAYYDGNNVVYDKCLGNRPILGTGYVYKTLPDGELYFNVYEGGELKYVTNTKGVFYSSFSYPVSSSTFDVDIKFYIWGGISIVRNENSDAEAEIAFQELAGRTELKIENGLRYKGYLGAQGNNVLNNSGFSVSNILPSKYNGASGNTINATGMSVSYVAESNKNDEGVLKTEDAFNGGAINYATGVSGIGDASYDITEGYPVLEDSDFDFSELVTKKSKFINYSEYFADYITYDFKPGEGIVPTCKGDNGLGSGNLMICAHSNDDSDAFIYTPTGNGRYIYLKVGSKKRPTYYVLCKYREGEHDSMPGDLCILKIDYYNNRRYKIYWSYLKKDNNAKEGGEEDTSLVTKQQRITNAKNIRNDLDKLLAYNTGGTYSRKFYSYMEPLENKRININANGGDWLGAIKTDYETYHSGMTSNPTLDSAYTYYCVDKHLPSFEENEVELYKIYPIFIYKKDNEDGIDLSYHLLESSFEGRILNSDNIPDVEGIILLDPIIYSSNTSVAYFKVSYLVDKGNPSEESDDIMVDSIDNARHLLFCVIDDESINVRDIPSVSAPSTGYNFFHFEQVNVNWVFRNDNGGNVGIDDETTTAYEVNYIFSIKMKPGDEKKLEEVDTNIYFYLSTEAKNLEEVDSESLRIIRHAMVDYYPYMADSALTDSVFTKPTFLPRVGDSRDSYDVLKGLGSEYDNYFLLYSPYSGLNTNISMVVYDDDKYSNFYKNNFKNDTIGVNMKEITTGKFEDKLSGYSYKNYSIIVDGGAESGYTECALINNVEGITPSGVRKEFKSNLLIVRDSANDGDFVLSQTEIDVPYYYSAFNKTVKLSQKGKTGKELLENLTLEWEKGLVRDEEELQWTLSASCKEDNDKLLITFERLLSDDASKVEWSYYDKENNLLSANTLYIKEGDKEVARIKVNRVPLYNLYITSYLDEYLTLTQTKMAGGIEATKIVFDNPGSLYFIPKASNDKGSFSVIATRTKTTGGVVEMVIGDVNNTQSLIDNGNSGGTLTLSNLNTGVTNVSIDIRKNWAKGVNISVTNNPNYPAQFYINGDLIENVINIDVKEGAWSWLGVEISNEPEFNYTAKIVAKPMGDDIVIWESEGYMSKDIQVQVENYKLLSNNTQGTCLELDIRNNNSSTGGDPTQPGSTESPTIPAEGE